MEVRCVKCGIVDIVDREVQPDNWKYVPVKGYTNIVVAFFCLDCWPGSNKLAEEYVHDNEPDNVILVVD